MVTTFITKWVTKFSPDGNKLLPKGNKLHLVVIFGTNDKLFPIFSVYKKICNARNLFMYSNLK